MVNGLFVSRQSVLDARWFVPGSWAKMVFERAAAPQAGAISMSAGVETIQALVLWEYPICSRLARAAPSRDSVFGHHGLTCPPHFFFRFRMIQGSLSLILESASSFLKSLSKASRFPRQ